ncbi:Pre-mRNA-splicing factor CWC22 [Nymphon striatum]|nr:Pre-mRNA-splicing factor CWC22 [Nymphon striatum]
MMPQRGRHLVWQALKSSRRKEKVGGRYWSDEEMNDDKNYDDSNEKSKEKRKVGSRYWDKKEAEELDNKENHELSPQPKKRMKVDPEKDMLTTRTGGAYIPPARLKMMQAKITDKSSVAYQRISWEALKKSLNGLINKINVSNIKVIIVELCKENIVRGSGVLARAVIQAQAVSGTFTAVYAALVSLINTKAHEVLALEILTLLLETPTEDSVEVAVSFLKECGARLAERLRNVLHESELEKRVQYMIEVVHAVRKDHFADYPAIPENLDLVEEEDQFTHMITLDEAVDSQDILDVFKFDENFEKNEEMYKKFTKGSDSESGSGSGSGSDADESGEESDEEKKDENEVIIDTTETNLIALRRTIYLTVQSSLSFEECCHKILRLNLKPEQEIEVCHMVIDCCAQERTYEKFFGLLAQRFCQLNRSYVEPFQQIFKSSYDTIHRLEVNKLRNITKLFAHLLFTDAISWMVLSHIRLNEEDTTSSSRIFIKILFLELSEYMGMTKLYNRIKDADCLMRGAYNRATRHR